MSNFLIYFMNEAFSGGSRQGIIFLKNQVEALLRKCVIKKILYNFRGNMIEKMREDF